MADDGVLGDTFRSNTGSLVLNGKNTYTKPEIIEPIRNHNSSSSTSSSSSASSRGPNFVDLHYVILVVRTHATRCMCYNIIWCRRIV